MINTLKQIIFICITTALINAQSSTIKGVVSDSVNANALIGANVIIEGTSLGMATNNNGKYNISNVSPGTYNIKVSYIG
jgi:hypothetical protein